MFQSKDFIRIYLIICTIVSLVWSQAAMDKTALGKRQRFTASGFAFDLAGAVPDAVGTGGEGRRASVRELPSLEGIGISSVLFHIEACGINLPHIHPRATELFYVVEGRFQTGFVEENGGRVILNNVTKGQLTFFPEGLIHFEQNLGCSNATFYSAFNSEDPGVITLPNRLLDIPIQALTSSFNINETFINQLKARIVRNPSSGVGECRKRCGLESSGSNKINSSIGFICLTIIFYILSDF